MCGIWALFGFKDGLAEICISCFNAIQHRGPDAWRLEQDARTPHTLLGFQRLTIVDGLYGMQPMRLHAYPTTSLICNGEIYNCKRLKVEHDFPYETNCDVETIIHLYHTFGIDKTVKSLDGVFAFCLLDIEKKKVYLARDPYGVRPLFRLVDEKIGLLGVCSEAKGLIKIKQNLLKDGILEQFPPGHYQEWSLNGDGSVKLEKTVQYFTPGTKPGFVPFVSEIALNKLNVQEAIALLLEQSVTKRLMSDRRIGCLLSGGLDSSLISALVVKLAKKTNLPYKIQTFSIGMKDSPDLKAAREVADYLQTDHHEVIFTDKDIHDNLDSVIYTLETYDITTIRASLPMYLLSKYIKENTDTTVLFSGEGADELAQGYIYFRNAPDSEAAHNESLRLLSDIYLYDGLRADRSTAAFSLELRVPFLDIQFTSYYLSLDAKIRQPKDSVEKYLLRNSFKESQLLPDSILWRHKEAFSDGVASKKKSLFQILQEIVSERLVEEVSYSNGPKPKNSESKYYRYVFEKTFKGQYNFTPYYWMPKWVEVDDPSARFIQHYNAE